MRIVLFCMLLLVCATPLSAQEPAGEAKYTLFRGLRKSDGPLPEMHPRMEVPKEKWGHDFVMLSVQEDDLLKVAFYEHNLRGIGTRFYVHNPTKRDFRGMPAKYLAGEHIGGVVFADGTVLRPYLPPDAQPIGSSEWPREMRWRRLYKNYYYATVYTDADFIGYDGIITEKNGEDIGTFLGESSAEMSCEKFPAVWCGKRMTILHTGRGYEVHLNLCNKKKEHKVFNLVPVNEQDLPPDFPKGLVRWIP